METSGSRSAADRPSSQEDQAALLRLYHRTRDASAREKLIELHLPLVRSLARRYAHRGERLEDLVQVGTIGLIESIDRFDPSRGASLVSFAVPTINGEIQRHLRDRSTVVRVPRRLAPQAPVPLCVSLVESESRALESGRDIDGALVKSEERLLLAAGFRTLPVRERRILHLRFFAGLSQTEIAREVGLSQIQVSRLIRDSLERLRPVLETNRTVTRESLVVR